MTTAALLLAGGSGARLRHPHNDNKVFVPIAGRPLLGWSVRAFDRSTQVQRLVVVVRDGDDGRAAEIVAGQRPSVAVVRVIGGRSRHDSEHAGLEALAPMIEAGAVDVVLIHDAARPFATPTLIDRVAEAARRIGGAVPTLPLGSGVHRHHDDGRLTPQPATLERAQTPQGFRARPLLAAYRRTVTDGFRGVDTCETVQRWCETTVAAIPGDPDNIKITYADDLPVAERIAGRRR